MGWRQSYSMELLPERMAGMNLSPLEIIIIAISVAPVLTGILVIVTLKGGSK